MNGNGKVGREQRVSREKPCQVCGGHPDEPKGTGRRCWGFRSLDGQQLYCTREEAAGKLKRHPSARTFAHVGTGKCPCGIKHVSEGGARPPVRPAAASASTHTGRSQIVATYSYVDEAGALLSEAVRLEPKAFLQRRPCPTCGGPAELGGSGGSIECEAASERERCRGGWVWNLDGVRRVVYRLPEVLAAAERGDRVYVVEGEKDVEALRAQGLVATCCPMGAGKWRDEFSEALRGAEVTVWVDDDDDGHQHGVDIIRSLRRVLG